jgi:glycine/D-amino acid oxidase-like deaminating enzyme
VVVNAGGPWSGAINRMAGVGSDFTVDTRPLRGEVHAIPAPPGLNPPGELGPCLGDPDLGYYLRPEPGGNALIGTMEPACDPLEWIDDPDTANLDRTAAGFERQVFRAARRFPLVTVPNQPVGIAGIYDVTPDWVPIYDRTDRKGFYVAIGTSGNQFKNAPLVGEFMAELVDAVESGTDLDAMPLQHQGRHTGQAIDLGTFSRRRALAPSVGNVIG